MKICEECGEELDGYVCKSCGLVSEEKELVSILPRKKEEDGDLSWSHPLSPSMEFQNIQPKSSTNSELNRALYYQNRKRKRSSDDYYMRAYSDLRTKCSQLHLPYIVVMECLHMAKTLIERKKTFFTCGNRDYKYLATVRIACRMNDIYLDKKRLVQVSIFHDNKPINLRNSLIKRTIDREMMLIKKELRLVFKHPKTPTFLNHACHVLGVDQEDVAKLYELYSKISNRFEARYKLNGYILALIYNYCGKKYKIGLGRIETEFGVARDTVRSRKKEIEVLLNAENETKTKI